MMMNKTAIDAMFRLFCFVSALLVSSISHAGDALAELSQFVEDNGVFKQVVTNDKGKQVTNEYRHSIVSADDKIRIEKETKTTRRSVGPFGNYYPNHRIEKWETSACDIYSYENKGNIKIIGNSYSVETNLIRLSFFSSKQEFIDLDKSVEDESFTYEGEGNSSADLYLKYSENVFADFLRLLEAARANYDCPRELKPY